jgi:hypothetical protein
LFGGCLVYFGLNGFPIIISKNRFECFHLLLYFIFSVTLSGF